VVLGGELAVPKKMYEGLAGRLGYAKVRRIKGQTRYATAVAVAEWGAALQLRWDGLAFCTGENFPDALSGGAMAGKLGSLMLLTRTATLPPDTAAALREHALAIGRLRVLGKPMAVSDATIAQADKAFGD
jgi:putative cell wall-binding protein